MSTDKLAQVQERIVALRAEIAEVQDSLERSEEYLAQARYAHERGWPCPRCGKPISDLEYADGDHPCLAIERENEVAARQRLSMLRTELEELQAVERELEQGVIYEDRQLPMVLKTIQE